MTEVARRRCRVGVGGAVRACAGLVLSLALGLLGACTATGYERPELTTGSAWLTVYRLDEGKDGPIDLYLDQAFLGELDKREHLVTSIALGEHWVRAEDKTRSATFRVEVVDKDEAIVRVRRQGGELWINRPLGPDALEEIQRTSPASP